MKKYIVILAAGLLTLGCNQSEIDKLNQENSSLSKEREHLIEQANAKDSTLDSFLGTLNDIEENLSTIKAKQSEIALSTEGRRELKTNVKEKIHEDIMSIRDLMAENKEMINALNSKLKKSNLNIHELNQKIITLNDQLVMKDEEISSLNGQLASLNIKIENLFSSIDTISAEGKRKSMIIEDQTNKLNTAYYALGTIKELKEKNVVNKENSVLGLVGLAGEKKLKPDFNKEYFTTIDISQTNSIPIGSKKAQLITTHPSDSYKFVHKGDKISDLVITNPENFWKASKYLVIRVY